METPEPYTLISTLGLYPAIITELIWTYATDPERPRLPERVILITTARGHAAWLEKAEDSGVWKTFCQEILGGKEIQPEFRTESRINKEPIIDIENRRDDLLVANIIYDEVHTHTRAGSNLLVGSLAGGRKTMSAHMMAAFTVFARSSDELVHILASKELENDKSFFYPPPGTKPDEVPLYRVNLPFAPMHAFLVRDFFGEMPDDDRDLDAMIKANESYQASPPAHAVIHIDKGGWQSSSVQLINDAGNQVDTFQISRASLCTLLVLAQQLYTHPEGIPNQDLLHPTIQDQYRAVNALFDGGKVSNPWTETIHVTRAISRLGDALKLNETVFNYLGIKKINVNKNTTYTWVNPRGITLKLIGYPALVEQATHSGWTNHFPDFQIQQVNR